MQVHIAVAKVPKSGLLESGDTVEIVERPRGGMTAIMADGQTHGRSAKRISQLVVTKAAQLIGDGVRDGAVARGVHDHLYAVRDGRVSAELVMISTDFRPKTLVISRNSRVPVFLRDATGAVIRLDENIEPIGTRESMKPLITEVPMAEGLLAVAFTDGIYSAGRRYDQQMDMADVQAMVAMAQPDRVQELADGLLERAMDLDRRHPVDDMCVVVVAIGPKWNNENVRRMGAVMPV